jgi:arylsulfatase
MNSFTKITSTFLAGSIIFSCSTGEQDSKLPNIVLILADDMGYSDISPYGSEIHTPNLEKLANEGVIMTRFYNAARCCPSRASLLTGLYPHQTGLAAMADQRFDIEGYQGFLSDNAVTIAEVLKMQSYRTYMAGKWHVGDVPSSTPDERGFDRSFVFLNGATSYYNIEPYRDSSWIERVGPIELSMELDGESYTPPESGYYATDAYTDYAISFIEKDKGDNKPFFLYLAYTAPHWPLHAPEDDIQKYEGRYKQGWHELRLERFRKQKELGIVPEQAVLSPTNAVWLNWNDFTPGDIERYDRKMAVYAAMTDRMDQNIGKLLESLEEQGELQNTLVIFLSDNGGDRSDEIGFTDSYDKSGPIGSEQSFTGYGPGWANASNTPFRKAKARTFFGGIATPFIAWYPSYVNSGDIIDYQGHINDIMPTILDYANIEYPGEYNSNLLPGLPGQSLRKIWEGEHSRRKDPLFFEHFGNRAVIDGDWKLVSLVNENWELYNIKNDPVELNNLIDSLPEKAKILENLYSNWADSLTVLDIKDHDKHRLKR